MQLLDYSASAGQLELLTDHTGGMQIMSMAALEYLDLQAGNGDMSDVWISILVIFPRNIDDGGTAV